MTAPGRDSSLGMARWTEALTWFVRLSGADENELNSTVGREWQDWYTPAENRRVFDGVSRLLSDRGLYRKRGRPGKVALEEDRYDLSVPIAAWLESQARHETQKSRASPGKSTWWLSGGLAVAAITVLFTLSPLRFRSGSGLIGAVAYQTGVGGFEEVHLRDGSSITLGGSTKVLVAFSAERRSVSLVEGQAWFKVVHDLRRPFVVSAGDGTITDLGTAFLVTRESDRVVVTVTEGTVEVKAWPSMWSRLRLDKGISVTPAMASIRVGRGEQLTFSSNGALSRVDPTDTHAATAWTRGCLTFDDQPLRYVVETVNRYSSRQIIVSPAAGRLRLSGVVFESDIQGWLQNLEVIFPVSVREQEGILRIQMRRAMQSSANSPMTRAGR